MSKLDSNSTGLRFEIELTPGVLPGSPVWKPLEPNSYGDFGADVTVTARRPINDTRQLKKGVVTDLDATAGFQNDLTQTGLAELLPSFMFAAEREKNKFGGTSEITNVDGTAEEYDGTSIETGMELNDLLLAQDFTNSENNGLKVVDNVTGPDTLGVAENLVDEASPPATARVQVVGSQGVAGDFDIDASGSKPELTSAAKDMTEFGLIPGEWMFIGGDAAALAFTNTENNGFKRVFSIAVNSILFDKVKDGTMITEASTTETIQLFFGDVLVNEAAALQVKSTVQFERTLDTAIFEYITGCVANTLTLNLNTAAILTVDMEFMGEDQEIVTVTKSGTKPALVESEAFNTTSDISVLNLFDSDLDKDLAIFIEEATLVISNNTQANKALKVLGACGVSAGAFQISGTLTLYFCDEDAINAIRNNDDVTVDFTVVKNNAGITFDVPLIALGGGQLNIEIDQPIKMPVTFDGAASGGDDEIGSAFDHTLLINTWNYLPNTADV